MIRTCCDSARQLRDGWKRWQEWARAGRLGDEPFSLSGAQAGLDSLEVSASRIAEQDIRDAARRWWEYARAFYYLEDDATREGSDDADIKSHNVEETMWKRLLDLTGERIRRLDAERL